MDKRVLTITLSPSCIKSQIEAAEKYFRSLDSYRQFTDLGRGNSYPFGQNQSEFELSIFARGWNAAIEWMVNREEKQDV